MKTRLLLRPLFNDRKEEDFEKLKEIIEEANRGFMNRLFLEIDNYRSERIKSTLK